MNTPFLTQAAGGQILNSGLTAIIVAYLVYVAIADYKHLRISNRSVLFGMFLYATWAIFGSAANIPTDAAAGLILFLLGFTFWMFKVAGAGDAKFMLVCGALTGIAHLTHFAIALVVVSLVLFIAIKVASRPHFQAVIVLSRMGTIVESGKAPYGVALALATIFSFLLRTAEFSTM